MRGFCSLALIGACLCGTSLSRAQTQVLIAASDPTQVAEVDVVKVIANGSSLWLSVKLAGQTKLAIASSAANLEAAADSDAWLRALDFATRVRVAPPLGPLAACPESTGKLADSGLPEPSLLSPSQVSSVTSDLELRRSLAEAGLAVDVTRVAQFSADAAAPFRVAVYDAGQSGGSTLAVRMTDTGDALQLPGIAVAERDFVPLTLLALAPTAVLPATGTVSDPSEFAVSYLAASASTDYAAARSAWLSEDPTRWLVEKRASSALFAWTVFPGAGAVEPALAHYLQATPAKRDAQTCFAAIQVARARASQQPSDYVCDGADDLARSLSELNFGDIRVTRLFGSATSSAIALRSSDDAESDSRLIATDFDVKNCSSSAAVSSGVGSTLPAGGVSAPSTGNGSSDVVVGASNEDPTTDVSDTSGSDSCTGDGSSDSGSSDSCSGDSSSDSSSDDSCSGDSSSDSSSKDSCSGDSSSSSSSSDDSSGCGTSNYDGDTCSGSSASSANADGKTSSALEADSPAGSRRPRRVHLSLWTLLCAALALPLRRRALWRSLTT
ncbi:MAG TPA: hypothetical protein VK745_27680 [Polyangiaceae bacterium]|nr:hypothetical protein [Polyangiaceae bacterium]